jgi:hypothetical protein
MQDPRPVAPGTARGSIGTSFDPYPSFHLGVRVGVLPHVELRAKLSAISDNNIIQSAQFGLNIELPIAKYQSIFYMPYARFDPEIREPKDLVSMDPQHPSHSVRAFVAPVLFVQHYGEGNDFFIGPELQIGARDDLQFIAVGGHIGLSFAAGSHGSITPEFSVLTTVSGTARPNESWETGSQTRLLPGDVIAEFGLSYSFGAAY